MNICFTGEYQEVEDGIKTLQSVLDYSITKQGISIKIEKTSGDNEVIFKYGEGVIKYNRKINFFRCLGLFLQEIQERDSFKIYEKSFFKTTGAMFDCSHNAVMKIESIKNIISYMAVMGLNLLMFNMENTYTIEDEPYFGYMRGRYTKEELKECDDYADIFGIEIIPIIQTLSHLDKFLRWDAVSYLRDTNDTLLVGEEKTYEFIEKMIVSVSSPFRSNRIHLGMDEAHSVGLGRYLKINGYHDRFTIMNNHLKRVVEITQRHNLKPMIWSDMYFRLGSKTGAYYDLNAVIPEEVIKNIPDNIQLVYWDYYHNDEEFYTKFIEQHKKMNGIPIFAGGIWTWEGMCTNYGKTFITTNAALNACKKEGVQEVFATMWGGIESDFFSTLLGLQLYAEHAFNKEVDTEKLKGRVKHCTGVDFDAFMDLKYLDEIPGTKPENLDSSNPSKCLLWQDILLGVFDKHIEGLDVAHHYANLEEKMKVHQLKNKNWEFVFIVPEKMCKVLKIKSNIGLRIKKAYDEKDFDELKRIRDIDLPKLIENIKELRIAHRDMWFKIYKPFGWEIIDLRYGGLLTRVDTTIKRLTGYIEGDIDRIDELEEERLYFDGLERDKSLPLMFSHNYSKIASPNSFKL